MKAYDEETFTFSGNNIVYRTRAFVVPSEVDGGWNTGAVGGVVGNSKKTIAIGDAQESVPYSVIPQ